MLQISLLLAVLASCTMANDYKYYEDKEVFFPEDNILGPLTDPHSKRGGSDFLRFGRQGASEYDDYLDEPQKGGGGGKVELPNKNDNFIRFGRSGSNENFMRFGRAHLRFPKAGGHSDFLRFGRNVQKSRDKRQVNFGGEKRNAKNDFIRFGRSKVEGDKGYLLAQILRGLSDEN